MYDKHVCLIQFSRTSAAFARLSRDTIVYGICINVYNVSHAKFKIKYATEEQQRFYARLVKTRWLASNPLDYKDAVYEVDISCVPANESDGWTEIELKDLEDMRKDLQLPELPVEDYIEALNNFCLGTYR